MAAGRRSETPLTRRVNAKMTRFRMEPATAQGASGAPCVAVVRIRCSVRVSTEQLFIGGKRCRVALSAGGGAEEDDGEAVAFAVDDPAVLRSEGACRGAIRRMLMALPQLTRFYGDRTMEAQWDEFVPPDVAASIVAAVAATGGAGSVSYACDVSMHVDATVVYSEAKALVESCEGAATPTVATGRRRSGGGAEGGQYCTICMEELAAAAAGEEPSDDDNVADLPGCSHAFHRGCIVKWFDMAATCPFCRRDMMQYLHGRYRVYHAYMLQFHRRNTN